MGLMDMVNRWEKAAASEADKIESDSLARQRWMALKEVAAHTGQSKTEREERLCAEVDNGFECLYRPLRHLLLIVTNLRVFLYFGRCQLGCFGRNVHSKLRAFSRSCCCHSAIMTLCRERFKRR